MAKDLRTFLEDLVAQDPAALRIVDRPVQPRFEITAYGDRFARDHQYPALLFTSVVGAKTPCITNVVSEHIRMAIALQVERADLMRSLGGADARRRMDPVTVPAAEAPVKEVILRGDDIDLGQLPIPVHNEFDGGPFVTAGVMVMRDPVSGALNAGIYRHQVYDARHMGVWFFGTHHGGVIHRRYVERGESAPIAIVIGHHPAFLAAAINRVPGIGGEFELAGSYLTEPLEVIKAESSDLLVPARAEIVLEGRIVLGEERAEGPFAEWPGHYIGGGQKPVIEIDCITMRRDAIFQDIQASGREHRLLGALPRISSIYNSVAAVVPEVRAVNVPLHARMHCYVSIKKTHPNDATRAGFAALNTEPENLRMIVVVDDDIDVYDEEQVMWAIGTRFDAPDDLLVIPGFSGPGGLLPTNWSYDAAGGRTPRRSSAVIVDATKPAPPVKFPDRARVPVDVVSGVDPNTAKPISKAVELPWKRKR